MNWNLQGDEYCWILNESCSQITNMPDFSFKFDTTTYSMPAASYLQDMVIDSSNTTNCVLNIVSLPSFLTETMILGFPFVEQFAVQFDYEKNKIGFA